MAGLKFSFGEKGVDLLKKMTEHIAGMRHGYAKAGVLGDDAAEVRSDEGLRNVDIAMIHEFGVPERGIPERSFIRGPFNANRDRYVEMLRKLVKGMYELKIAPRQVLGLVGLQMSSDMRRAIETSSGGNAPFVPNKPATIARKGSSRPLVDQGILKNSISFAVVANAAEARDDDASGEIA